MTVATRYPESLILAPVADRSEPVPALVHFANGVVKMKGFHLDGEMHGAWEWYRTDGSVMRTGAFVRGKQVGPWRTFARSGQVVKETDFGPSSGDGSSD